MSLSNSTCFKNTINFNIESLIKDLSYILRKYTPHPAVATKSNNGKSFYSKLFRQSFFILDYVDTTKDISKIGYIFVPQIFFTNKLSNIIESTLLCKFLRGSNSPPYFICNSETWNQLDSSLTSLNSFKDLTPIFTNKRIVGFRVNKDVTYLKTILSRDISDFPHKTCNITVLSAVLIFLQTRNIPTDQRIIFSFQKHLTMVLKVIRNECFEESKRILRLIKIESLLCLVYCSKDEANDQVVSIWPVLTNNHVLFKENRLKLFPRKLISNIHKIIHCFETHLSVSNTLSSESDIFKYLRALGFEENVHFKRVTGTSSFMCCLHCQVTFVSIRRFIIHWLNLSERERFLLRANNPCTLCDESSIDLYTGCPHHTTDHRNTSFCVRRWTSKSPLWCDLCGVKCFTRTFLRLHRRRHFLHSSCSKFCSYCNREFNGNALSFKLHIKSCYSTHEKTVLTVRDGKTNLETGILNKDEIMEIRKQNTGNRATKTSDQINNDRGDLQASTSFRKHPSKRTCDESRGDLTNLDQRSSNLDVTSRKKATPRRHNLSSTAHILPQQTDSSASLITVSRKRKPLEPFIVTHRPEEPVLSDQESCSSLSDLKEQLASTKRCRQRQRVYCKKQTRRRSSPQKAKASNSHHRFRNTNSSNVRSTSSSDENSVKQKTSFKSNRQKRGSFVSKLQSSHLSVSEHLHLTPKRIATTNKKLNEADKTLLSSDSVKPKLACKRFATLNITPAVPSDEEGTRHRSSTWGLPLACKRQNVVLRASRSAKLDDVDEGSYSQDGDIESS